MLPGVGRRARAVRSDAPRRQPVWHAPSHCQRACPARCSQPAAAADQASAGSAYVPGSQPSPRCGVAARSRPPAARTRSWQAGQAAALVELATRAAGRRARAVPGDHRVPERAAPPTDGSRRGGTPLRLTRVTARTGTRGRHSLLRAKRTACPGGPLCRRPGPGYRPTFTRLHAPRTVWHHRATGRAVSHLTYSQASVRARRFQGLLAAACLAATWRGAKRPPVQE